MKIPLAVLYFALQGVFWTVKNDLLSIFSGGIDLLTTQHSLCILDYLIREGAENVEVSVSVFGAGCESVVGRNALNGDIGLSFGVLIYSAHDVVSVAV